MRDLKMNKAYRKNPVDGRIDNVAQAPLILVLGLCLMETLSCCLPNAALLIL
jgi:hypothetical protein